MRATNLLSVPFSSASGKFERLSDAVLSASFNPDLTINAPAPPPTIYMDNMATTPIDPRVVVAMMPYLTTHFANPHSVTHRLGHDTGLALIAARGAVADVINAHPDEIVFTSGATESNNIAVKGAARGVRAKEPARNVVLTAGTEHKCVLESAKSLRQEGFEYVTLPVDTDGKLILSEFDRILAENAGRVAVVSVMAVNNEIGTIQPIREIAQRVHAAGGVFHCDAAQGFGKIPLDVVADEIDLMSISAHKIYGPKGTGALFVSRRSRSPLARRGRLPVISPVSGGGQEQGLRSGTVATPNVVGMGAAAEIIRREGEADCKRIAGFRDVFMSKVGQLPSVTRNGAADGYAGCINLSFDCVEGESLMMGMPDVAVSSGSACTSKDLKPSYVLEACGKPVEEAHSSIRFGLGRFTTEEEVNYVADSVVSTVNRLRDMSPLWDMKLAGIDLTKIQWAEDHHH